jgi:type IV pilus assembly protein PilN
LRQPRRGRRRHLPVEADGAGWTSAQQGRNEVLRTEIAALDKQIQEISNLETQRDRLRARLQVIQQLQRSRPEVVHLFEELVNNHARGRLPDRRRAARHPYRDQSNAQSSTRVSALMRNIDDSQWLRSPGLQGVDFVNAGTERNAQFTRVRRASAHRVA